MDSARRRLFRDLRRLQTDPPYGVNGVPVKGDIFKWKAVIFGPEDSVWEGATFHLTLDFCEEYPNKPPEVQFVSRIFHPNVYADGRVCLDILQTHWSPVYDISSILTSIQSLLTDPNPDSPANAEAAKLFSDNRREYNTRVQSCVIDSFEDEPSENSVDDSVDV